MPCREATAQELLACHTGELVTKVQELANAASFSGRETGLDRTYFTSDTYVRPSTFRCASLAAGGCVEVATAVARYAHAMHYMHCSPCKAQQGHYQRNAARQPDLSSQD